MRWLDAITDSMNMSLGKLRVSNILYADKNTCQTIRLAQLNLNVHV